MLARYGIWVAGAYWVLDRVQPLINDAFLTRAEQFITGLVVALATIGTILLAWIVERVLTTIAEMIAILGDQAAALQQTAELIETRLVPALDRIVARLDQPELGQSKSSPPAPPPLRFDPDAAMARVPVGDGRSLSLAVIRRALDSEKLGEAERLIGQFRRDFPDAPELDELDEAADRVRRAIVARLRDQLTQARADDDAEQVIAVRDELTMYLRGPTLHKLDRRLVTWLTDALQRRLADADRLAEATTLIQRIGDSFGDAPEAEHLLRMLPELKRRTN